MENIRRYIGGRAILKSGIAKRRDCNLENRQQRLIHLLNNCAHFHKKSADKAVLDGLKSLIKTVKTKPIAIADSKGKETFFGRKYVFDITARIFDPIINDLCAKHTFVHSSSLRFHSILPLSKSLKQQANAQAVGLGLRSLIEEIEKGTMLESNPHEELQFTKGKQRWKRIYNQKDSRFYVGHTFTNFSKKLSNKRAIFAVLKAEIEDFEKEVRAKDNPSELRVITESLHAIAELIEAINLAIPLEQLNWCKFCFRRCVEGDSYCVLHSPSGSDLADSNYRQAKKIFKCLPKESVTGWKHYRTLRRLIGESIELIARVKDVPSATSADVKLIFVTEEIYDLCEQLTTSAWIDIAPKWTTVLDAEFALCNSKLKITPEAHENWTAWLRYARDELKNPLETTTDPYWVIQDLICIEEWLQAESSLVDNRRTNSAEEIEKLIKSGTTKTSEICKKTGKSKTYICRVRKERGI